MLHWHTADKEVRAVPTLMNEIPAWPPTTTGPILRKLTASERWFMLVDRNRPNHFSLTAEISGRTTPEMWRAALDGLQRRHPLLNVCLETDENSVASFRRMDGTRIPLAVFERTEPVQWRQEAERQISKRFDPTIAPLVRAFLWHSDNRCDLMLWAHHTIADGMAMAILIRDLVAAAAGQISAPLPMPLSQDTRFASLDLSSSNERVGNKSATSPASRKAGFQPPGCALKIDTFQLSQEETRELAAAARQQRTTVHAAILAAIVLAGRVESPRWKAEGVRASSPISLRKILAIEDDCVVAQTAGVIFLKPAPDVNLWDLARTAKQQIAPWEKASGIATILAFFEQSTPIADESTVFSQAAERSGCELVLTNLGRVPFESRFGQLSIEAIWGPIVNQGYENEQIIGVTTVNEVLCLTLTTDKPIESLLKNSMALLMSACRIPVLT